jgi:hypothetical protein
MKGKELLGDTGAERRIILKKTLTDKCGLNQFGENRVQDQVVVTKVILWALQITRKFLISWTAIRFTRTVLFHYVCRSFAETSLNYSILYQADKYILPLDSHIWKADVPQKTRPVTSAVQCVCRAARLKLWFGITVAYQVFTRPVFGNKPRTVLVFWLQFVTQYSKHLDQRLWQLPP